MRRLFNAAQQQDIFESGPRNLCPEDRSLLSRLENATASVPSEYQALPPRQPAIQDLRRLYSSVVIPGPVMAPARGAERHDYVAIDSDMVKTELRAVLLRGFEQLHLDSVPPRDRLDAARRGNFVWQAIRATEFFLERVSNLPLFPNPDEPDLLGVIGAMYAQAGMQPPQRVRIDRGPQAQFSGTEPSGSQAPPSGSRAARPGPPPAPQSPLGRRLLDDGW